MNRQLGRALSAIAARSAGAYVVGGAVRDRLLGVPAADIDISVPGSALEIANGVISDVAARVIVLDRERDHIRLAVHSGASDTFIDLTSHAEGLEKDLRSRDFTINAMAVRLEAWRAGGEIQVELVDPTGGAGDLEGRCIRMVAARSFADDPVRLLRAARFACQFGFDIEPGTSRACQAMAARIGLTSQERVREELYAVFGTAEAVRGVRLLDELGLLDVIIPELSDGKGVGQPPNHHYYDVFDHCVRTVAKIDPVLDSATGRYGDPRLARIVPPGHPGLETHLGGVVGDGQSHRTLLRLCALLHDVAKPRCKSFDEQGRMRFHGHGDAGAEMATGILTRLKCSRRVISHVATMVRHHLRPGQISRPGEAPSPRALVRYFNDLGGAAIDIIYLNMADYLAARGPLLSASDWRDYSNHCGAILSGGLEAPERSRPFLLLDGNEVMAEFGLKAGPEVGRLMKALRSAEADGAVQTRQDALEFLRRLV